MRVKYSAIGAVEVSTVSLEFDHQYGDGPPLLFETMVFGGPMDGSQWRYATLEEAEKGHCAIMGLVAIDHFIGGGVGMMTFKEGDYWVTTPVYVTTQGEPINTVVECGHDWVSVSAKEIEAGRTVELQRCLVCHGRRLRYSGFGDKFFTAVRVSEP